MKKAGARSGWIRITAGPAAALIIGLFFHPDPGTPEIGYTLAIAAWIAIWWITEALPLAVTSLLPVVLFPLLGIMDGQEVSSAYFNHVIFLFIGGFLVAMAMERWNLHRRIALGILLLTGKGRARILLGFMVATALLSMWISNTATAMMMVPIVMAVAAQLEPTMAGKRSFSTGLLLGVAYSASIGGIMTLVGTPPNLSFLRIYQVMFPEASPVSFVQWMSLAVPVGLLMLAVAWIILILRYVRPNSSSAGADTGYFRQEWEKLGKMTREEKFVLTVFLAMAILWITRSDIAIGKTIIPGWSGLFGNPGFINDGTVAIALAIPLFILPVKGKPGGRIMDWNAAKGLPWDIVLLFGGGFALANGFRDSGLSTWFGTQMAEIGHLPPILVILAISLLVTFLTELTSNTATTEMILPVLAGLAVATDTNPLLFMVPATLSASMAFMMPAATPPNALIFGTRRVSITEMAKTGLWLNLAGALIISGVVYLLLV